MWVKSSVLSQVKLSLIMVSSLVAVSGSGHKPAFEFIRAIKAAEFIAELLSQLGVAADAVFYDIPYLRDAWDVLRFPDGYAGRALAEVIVRGLEVSPGIGVGVLRAERFFFYTAAMHFSNLRANRSP